MLTIRNDQLEVFRMGAQKEFAAEMLARVAKEYPENHTMLSEAGTRRLIAKGLADREKYRLGGLDVVGIYIELMVEFGESFQRTPDREWIVNMLELEGVPGAVKIMAIAQRIATTMAGRRLVVDLPKKDQADEVL